MRKLLFYYIRIALVAHIVLLLLAPILILKTGYTIETIDIIFICIFLFSFPVFFILRGVIYEGEKTSFYDRQSYGLFVGLTLGLGPLIIYFKKYDSQLKRMIGEEGTGHR